MLSVRRLQFLCHYGRPVNPDGHVISYLVVYTQNVLCAVGFSCHACKPTGRKYKYIIN